jgi:hypothetical protein
MTQASLTGEFDADLLGATFYLRHFVCVTLPETSPNLEKPQKRGLSAGVSDLKPALSRLRRRRRAGAAATLR